MGLRIDGKGHAAKVCEKLTAVVKGLAQQGITPGLHVLLVGDDPASQVYVENKAKRAHAIGISSHITRMPEGVSFEELTAEIHSLNENPAVDGILVQLPIPGLPTRAVLDLVAAEKDVDGFHATNVGLLLQKRPRFVPCTPLGVLSMLDAYNIEVTGKTALVIGRSDIVGKPMAALLTHRNATVTIAHSRTQNLEGLIGEADIVVAALGRERAISAAWIREGAVVIDVGIHRMENGKLTGDVHPEGLADRASAYTPVPGGVGPMTIAMLMVNTVQAALLRRGMDTSSLGDLIPEI
jgi:methylenetetrahydrofolate dehydrogenase (NADP+)/methenyltetrahydrofolate cyclohydrolase